MIALEELATRLMKRLAEPLPGSLAHEPMRATPAGVLTPKFEHKLPPKPGSVLILLHENERSIRFPLTKRQDYAGAHSGQISLPGGKTEPGESLIATALREAEEEIGIDRNQVRVIGPLSNFFVIPSNFLVMPVVAYTLGEIEFKPDPFEVARVFNADIFELIRDDASQTKEILAANRYPMIAPHFAIDGEIVWGATAMMLNELRTVLREVL